jgi:hypothetical protein
VVCVSVQSWRDKRCRNKVISHSDGPVSTSKIVSCRLLVRHFPMYGSRYSKVQAFTAMQTGALESCSFCVKSGGVGIVKRKKEKKGRCKEIGVL